MEDNATRQITIKLSGDDFTNPDGTFRQEYLKLAYDNTCAGDWELAPFHYSDKETFAVLYNGNCIGTVPQKRYEELRSILDKITHLSVTVREYIPDYGRAADPSAEKHYQAYLSVDYKAEVSASFAPPSPPPAPAYAPSQQSSEQALEELFAAQEKQLARLEQQRKTLTFSSPEEEADADRRLADLKRRHTETVAEYRKLQAARAQKTSNTTPAPTSATPISPSNAPSPQPPSLPRRRSKNLLTVIAIVLLLLTVFCSAFRSISDGTQAQVKLSKDGVIQCCVSVAEEYMPGKTIYEWDKGRDTFTVFLWDDSFKSAGLAAKSGDAAALDAWDDFILGLKTICAAMQIKFRDAGYGTTVAVAAVDPDNHDSVYVLVSKNKVLYDATWN